MMSDVANQKGGGTYDLGKSYIKFIVSLLSG